MHPIFIARGPAFKKNYKSEPFETVNIYPLMCHLLDIRPRLNNGSLDNVEHILSDDGSLDMTLITCETFACRFDLHYYLALYCLFDAAKWFGKSTFNWLHTSTNVGLRRLMEKCMAS